MSDAGPVEKSWKTEDGLFAIVLMNHMGFRCGYVAVEPGHPFHGKHYNEVKIGDEYPDVHGGLTYAAPCAGAVCHDGPEDLWWFGFDAGHLGDSPDPENPKVKEMNALLEAKMGRPSIMMEGKHRSQQYMERECVKLSKQLASLLPKSKSEARIK